MIFTNVPNESLCPPLSPLPSMQYHPIGPPVFKKTSTPMDAAVEANLKRYVEYVRGLNSQASEDGLKLEDDTDDDHLSELPRAENIG